jgi:hypothetical protein
MKMQRYDQSAKYVLVCLIVGFLAVLTIGWGEMLSQTPTFSFLPTTGWAVGFVIAIFAIFLAQAVASETLRVKKDRESAFAGVRFIYFTLLLAISAVGTANFMYEKVFAEGANDRNAILITVINDLNNLKIKGRPFLSADSVRESVEEIKLLSNKLKTEILNPDRCGHGPTAKTYERLLRDKLGTHFSPRSGAEFMDSCSQQFANIYTEAVERALLTWPQSQPAWQLEERLPKFEQLIETEKQKLQAVIESESSVDFEPAARRAQLAFSEIRESFLQLFPAAQRPQVESAIPTLTDVERSLRDLKGNNAYNKATLLIREAATGNGKAIAILLIALLADLFLVQAYGRHLYSLSRNDDSVEPEGDDDRDNSKIFASLKRNK